VTYTLLLTTLALSPVQTWGLENDDGGFVSTGDTNQWEWGPVESGPYSSHDGSNAWGTVLDGDYLNDSVDMLTLPPLTLSDLERPVLSFSHWIDIDEEGDIGTIETETAEGWASIDPIYGYPDGSGFRGLSGEWETVYFDLTGIDDLSQLRLRFSSDEIVARSGWFVDDFQVWDGDPTPPLITLLTESSDTEDLTLGPEIIAEIIDDVEVIDAQLVWQTGEGLSGSEPMAPDGSGVWAGALPAFEPDTTVQWEVRAYDSENQSISDSQSYRVYLPPPQEPSLPDYRMIATEFEITWSAPESIHPVVRYRVYRDDSLESETEALSVTVDALDSQDSFTIRALFDTPIGDREGDPTEALQAEVSIPRILSIQPDHAWAGDQVRLEIQGEYLLLSQGDISLDLGSSVEVREVDIQDVDTARFTVAISDDTSAGSLDLTLVSGALQLVQPDAFEILADSDRPTLLSVEPDALEQGDRATICILLNTPLEGADLQLDLGEGVYVESRESQDTRVWADLGIALDAPVGLHPVLLDDGVRIREGLDLRIRDRRSEVQAICSAAETSWRPTSPLCLLLGVLVYSRRRR
jgi:hypothetical protein